MLAVGKVKPPYADDVAHYERLLQRQARVDVGEVADEDAVARRLPERAYVSLLDAMEDNWSKWRTTEGIKNLPEVPPRDDQS